MWFYKLHGASFSHSLFRRSCLVQYANLDKNHFVQAPDTDHRRELSQFFLFLFCLVLFCFDQFTSSNTLISLSSSSFCFASLFIFFTRWFETYPRRDFFLFLPRFQLFCCLECKSSRTFPSFILFLFFFLLAWFIITCATNQFITSYNHIEISNYISTTTTKK